MASVALVLSILVPSVGNWWYGLTALSPAAWFYYYQKGERQEEFKIKMVRPRGLRGCVAAAVCMLLRAC